MELGASTISKPNSLSADSACGVTLVMEDRSPAATAPTAGSRRIADEVSSHHIRLLRYPDVSDRRPINYASQHSVTNPASMHDFAICNQLRRERIL